MPEGPPWYQLIEGELVVSPSPSWHHQRISHSLVTLIDAYLAQKPIGELAYAPMDVYLSDRDVAQPDLLFISNARRHLIAADGVHGAPDLIIEILSPSTARLDAIRKRRIYASAGVDELWLVDPAEKCVQRWRLRENPSEAIEIIDENGILTSSNLPGLEISVATVFRR